MFARPPIGWRSLVALLGLVLFARPGTSPLSAQGLVVASRQSLAFGGMVPGQSKWVQPSDVVNRAEVVVDGKGKYTVSFLLPTALVRTAGGAQMPITFAATDGLMIEKNRNTTFDPNGGTAVNLNGKETVRLCVGGTVRATPTQAAGTYEATITVVVVP